MKLFLPLIVIFVFVTGCKPPSASRSTVPTEPPPTISFSKPRFKDQSGVYTLMTFEVTNTSNRPLEFVQIHADFYDKQDRLIAAEQPYIHRYTSLAPGQSSAAEVMVAADAKISRYKLSFTARGTAPFSTVDVVATPIEPEPLKRKK